MSEKKRRMGRPSTVPLITTAKSSSSSKTDSNRPGSKEH
jgi:hypothetical protein